MNKICIDCTQPLPIGDFGANGKTRTGKQKVKPRCNKCIPFYERRIFYTKLFNLFGGKQNYKCQRCGYNKCIAALEFHHIDPKTKDNVISLMKNYSIAALKAEIEKCILLCANCHREEHAKTSIVESVVEHL